jgi:hypothetical protein
VLGAAAHAQAAKSVEQELADLKKRVANIEAAYVGQGELARINEIVAGVQKVNDEQTQVLRNMAETLATAGDTYVKQAEFDAAVSAMTDINQRQDQELTELRRQFDKSVFDLQGVVDRLGEISENRPGIGHVPVLSRQARETPFAQTLVINEMQFPVWASVNGVFRELQPRETWPVQVRPGTVTTTLPGYEAARNWVVGAENGYQLTIRITPR